MKKLALILLLLQSPGLLAAKKPPVNPADYTLAVQVVQSRNPPTDSSSLIGYRQTLETLIDGQPVELQATVVGLFPLGTYKGRLVPSPYQPKNKTYDLFMRYELIMPDGTLRTYDVIGLGSTTYQSPASATPSQTNP